MASSQSEIISTNLIILLTEDTLSKPKRLIKVIVRYYPGEDISPHSIPDDLKEMNYPCWIVETDEYVDLFIPECVETLEEAEEIAKKWQKRIIKLLEQDQHHDIDVEIVTEPIE
jgi:hypothetical protein